MIQYHLSDVVAAIASRTGRSKKDVDEVLSAFLEWSTDVFAAGDAKLVMRGFGVLETRTKGPHSRFHPGTGEAISVPEKRTVGFRPSDRLKLALNDPDR